MKYFSPNRCFIVAEVSANHGQVFENAIDAIRAAKVCGVDAVKFQAYTPDTITMDVDNKYFRIEQSHWKGQTLYQLYEKAYTPWVWMKELKKAAEAEGLVFFATAFDKTSVDMLEEINVPIHKIASFELTDLPLIEYIGRTKKPLILSTGMATVVEIQEAIDAARKGGAKEIVLLKCTSNYPSLPEDMNLRTIPDMKERFGVNVGLSDHSMGIAVPVASVCMGATVIEKHFIHSSEVKSEDDFFSLGPEDFKNLVDNVRTVEKALGKVSYGAKKEQQHSLKYRRSLFAAQDIARGEAMTEANVRSIRPANGLAPKYMSKVLKKKAVRNIKKGDPLKWSLLK